MTIIQYSYLSFLTSFGHFPNKDLLENLANLYIIVESVKIQITMSLGKI